MGDTRVKIPGYFDIDQTLWLIEEVPLQDHWLGQNRLQVGLRNKVLQIPIQGTLARPEIDPQQLAQFSTRTADNSLIDKLNRQVDRLWLAP